MKDHDKIVSLTSRLEALKAERSRYESEWQELADIFQPGVQTFTSKATPWQEANRSIDGHGKYLVQKLVAHLFGQLTNPSTKWFQYKPADKNITLSQAAQEELETINDKILSIFNNHKSNFASECQALYSSMVIFGSGTLYVDNQLGTDVSFKTIPLSQTFISEDFKGNVDTVFRTFKYTSKQLIQAFGEENVSEAVRVSSKVDPEQTFEILHAVYPNLGAKRKKERFECNYIEIDTNHILRTQFYKNFPYKVPRWAKHVGEKYGHGQGKLSLSVIRSMTHIRLENHKSLAFGNNPVVLLSDDGVIIPNELKPGTVIEGAISSMGGERRLETWSPTGNPQMGLQLYELEKELLTKLFFIEDITMPVDKTRRTATESNLIDQDRTRFLAPFISRIESELLAPIVEHVLLTLIDNGALGQVSPEISGIELEAEFLSPLARLLKMEDSRAEQQFLQMALPLLQFKPELAGMINFEEIINDARIGTGSPAKVLKSAEEYAQVVQAQAQQQQQAMQMQNALSASEITKNVGQANKFNSGV